jgi:hypothetical protein
MANGFVSVSQVHLSNPVAISVSLKITSMEKRIDQLLIKVSGKMFLGRKLAIDDEVKLMLKGSVVKEEVGSNQDGSVNICYVFKATEVEVISDPNQVSP